MRDIRKKMGLMSKLSRPTFLLILSVFSLSSCQFQTYQAKPITSQKIAEDFEQRSITDQKFQEFLIAQGYAASELPLKTWDLKALTLCAHYFHPSLNVARAQWQAAQLAEKSAAQTPLPTINAGIARSNQANEDIHPFAYQFSIDIPIETHNKREIQIEGFSHLSEIAKLEIAQTAWQLRHNIAITLNEMRWHEAQKRLLANEIALKENILAMLEKRLQHGLASSVEINQAKLQLHTSQMALENLNTQKIALQSQLAQHLGLPLSAVTQMAIQREPSENKAVVEAKSIQKTALLNRLDARIALEQYKVAENKLKLEIAKQYPDITISPGLAYEFGDTIWSLGFSGLMNLLQKNKVAITEAEQFREVEVAKFEALQANIIGEANLANAQLNEFQALLAQKIQQRALQQQHFAKLQAQFNAGEIDRLNLTYEKLTLENTEKEIAHTQYQLEKAKTQLENTLEAPLQEIAPETIIKNTT